MLRKHVDTTFAGAYGSRMSDTITTKHADKFSIEAQLALSAEYRAIWLAISDALVDLDWAMRRHPEDAHRLREAIIAHLETVRPALERLDGPVNRLRFWYLDKYHAELDDAREAEQVGGADVAR